MDWKFKLAGTAAAAVLLAACGDDVTNVTNETGARTVSALKDAGKCEAGDLVVALDDATLYVCGEDGKWVSMRGNDGEAGAPGAKGDSGAAGASCAGRSIEGVGIEISCGGEVVDTLKRGRSGRSSEEASSDAVQSSSSAGAENLCGTTAYDAATHFCDARDNRVYAFTVVAGKTWMAENLDFGTMVFGRADQGDATASSAEKYCFNDNADSCASLGGLYQWHTAMGLARSYDNASAASAIQTTHRGICPEGWHVPDGREWSDLVVWADSANGGETGDEAASLKSAVGWSEGGSDDHGFNALPSGERLPGGFDYGGTAAFWWTTMEFMDVGSAVGRRIADGNADVAMTPFDRVDGLSLRCAKDE